MIRKKIQSINKGKYSLIYNGQKICSSVYIDFESLFIMVKGIRVHVKQNYKTKKYYIEGE